MRYLAVVDDVHARLTEAQVEDAFCTFLQAQGWQTSVRNPGYIDVIATRGEETLIAEAKGHTKASETAVDILYGQVLRRMRPSSTPVRYAIVVPHTLRDKVCRVHATTWARLGLEVYVVNGDLSVEKIG